MSVRDSSCSWKRSLNTCLVVLASFPYGPMVACHTCADKLSIRYPKMELWKFLEAVSHPSLPWLTTVGCMTFAWKANQSNSINMNHRKVKQQFSKGNNQNLLKACSAVHAAFFYKLCRACNVSDRPTPCGATGFLWVLGGWSGCLKTCTR